MLAIHSFSELLDYIFTKSEKTVYVSGSALLAYLRTEPLAGTSLKLSFRCTIPSMVEVLEKKFQPLLNMSKVRAMHMNEIQKYNITNIPNAYAAELELDHVTTIHMRFEQLKTEKHTQFDESLIMLGERGFLIPFATPVMNPATVLAKSIRNLMQQKTDLVGNSGNGAICDCTLLALLNEQNQIMQSGKKIGYGFKINTKIPCSICYSDHTEKPLFELRCSHVFCLECIDQHKCSFNLKHNNDCPLCRQQIDFILEDNISNET